MTEDAGIGHNMPPEQTPIEKIQTNKQYVALFDRMKELIRTAKDLPQEVTDEATAEKVGDWLKAARFAIKTADEARKIEYEPFKKIVDQINAIFNKPKEDVKKASDDIKERLDKYLTAKAARERTEREEKARKEREEAERAAREAAEAERRRLEAEEAARREREAAERAQREREEAERRAKEERERAEKARQERIEAEKRWKEDEAKRAEQEALRKQQQAEREAEAEQARAEAAAREEAHKREMAALRAQEQQAEEERRKAREEADRRLQERREAEERERLAKAEGREAKRDENMNMTMAERADRLAGKHERAASDDTANSRTRSDQGSLSSLQKRWTVEITDERKLPKDILWDYIPLEAKKAAVWKWMVNQPNDERLRRMEGALIERVATAQVR
jgi:hypothetical protein